MQQSRKSILLSFASPKGGVGKTTLTIHLANYLHYNCNFNIAVVDCNYPIYTISTIRRMEIEKAYRTAKAEVEFEKKRAPFNNRAYPIINSNVARAFEDVKELCRDEHFDVILFDLPQTMVVDGSSELLAAMDLVIFPTMCERTELALVSKYIDILNEHIITIGKSAIRDIYLLPNMLNIAQWNRIDDEMEKLSGQYSLSIIRNFIPRTKANAELSTLLSICSKRVHIKSMCEFVKIAIREIWNS